MSLTPDPSQQALHNASLVAREAELEARRRAESDSTLKDTGEAISGTTINWREEALALEAQLAEAVSLLREARAILPHGAFAGHRHDERHDLIARIDAALRVR